MEGPYSADLVITYDPSEIPDGTPKSSLVVLRYLPDTQDWDSLPTVIDESSHTATVLDLDEFSIFVLASEPPIATEVVGWGEVKGLYR